MRSRASVGRWVGIAFVIVWSLLPIYWALNGSLQTEADARSKPPNFFPAHPTLNNYSALFSGNSATSGQLWPSAVNSMIECGVSTVLTMVIATLAAYSFARMQFRGKNLLFYAVLATMAFPAYTTLIPLYQIMTAFGLVNTYVGIILVYASGFLPLATWILYNYLGSLPVSLEEAGLVDGATRMQVLFRIIGPLAWPGIISASIITFLSAWSQFLFPLVLASDITTQPMTVIVAGLQGQHTVPLTLLDAAGILVIVIPAVIALALNRYIVSGLLAGSVK
ncbi:carbohydrate ABC transporter permease [Arthrobacter sp. KNU-44]|uniref:carbohydrate ABC transporter permease n=1 Tax=Arthrobacter sp. KNU-44 TaxID=3450744 RepID=UPI003F43C6E1